MLSNPSILNRYTTAIFGTWTIVTAAADQHDAFYRSPAYQARLSFATIDPMLELEEALFTVGVHVVGDRRSAHGDGLAQHLLHSAKQPAKIFPAQRGGAPARPNAGPEQRFVRIDVTYAAQQFLVQKRALDRRLAALK